MKSLADWIDFEELSPHHREQLAAFEAAQESPEPAAWQKAGGDARALVRPDGSRFLTWKTNDTATDETWRMRIGAVLFVAGLAAAQALTDFRDPNKTLFVAGAVFLLGMGVWLMVSGRAAAEKTRHRVVHRVGLFLLPDALVQRIEPNGALCRAFPTDRLVGFRYQKMYKRPSVLCIDYRNDAGEVDYVMWQVGNAVDELEKWLAGVRAKERRAGDDDGGSRAAT